MSTTIFQIETSASYCSVALSQGDNILFSRSSIAPLEHAARLGVYTDEAMSMAEQNKLEIHAIAVSSGPGSYTGLRIGTALAKGLCYGYDIPLIAIPTLELMAHKVLKKYKHIEDSALLCPMIDARRMEVYTTLFNTQLEPQSPTTAEILTADFLLEQLEKQKIYFFGDGSPKFKIISQHPNVHFIEQLDPCALSMTNLAQQAFQKENFVDVAYFEPYYLKDFVATTSKKKFF